MNRFMKIISICAALLAALQLAAAQPQIRSQWEGARVAFLGDSITDARQIGTSNDVYWNNLRDILGIEAYVYGISGHQMSHIIGQAEKLEAEHGQDVDAILVFIGTNDFNSSIPLGEWYSYDYEVVEVDGPTDVLRRHRERIYDDSTFRGRANITMRWLKSHYPDKQIIFLTPLHRGYAKFSEGNIQPPEAYANACGFFIDDYVQAVKELGKAGSIRWPTHRLPISATRTPTACIPTRRAICAWPGRLRISCSAILPASMNSNNH